MRGHPKVCRDCAKFVPVHLHKFRAISTNKFDLLTETNLCGQKCLNSGLQNRGAQKTHIQPRLIQTPTVGPLMLRVVYIALPKEASGKKTLNVKQKVSETCPQICPKVPNKGWMPIWVFPKISPDFSHQVFKLSFKMDFGRHGNPNFRTEYHQSFAQPGFRAEKKSTFSGHFLLIFCVWGKYGHKQKKLRSTLYTPLQCYILSADDSGDFSRVLEETLNFASRQFLRSML